MSAPLGNRFWQQRSTHGRAPLFKDPNQLWEACIEYFEWVEDNPLSETRLFSMKDDKGANYVQEHELKKMRPMTVKGLCIFLDIAKRTWDGYCANEDFMPVCTRVREIIDTQKFEGAAADLLNPSIIARDLGLADKKEHSARVITAVEYTVVDPKPKAELKE